MNSRKCIVVALSILLALVGHLEALAAHLLVLMLVRSVLFLNSSAGARGL